MLRTAPALVALLALAASMPPASAAAHNAAWQSEGVAVDTNGNVFLFMAHFHGTCTSTFTVELRTPSNTLLERRTFAGFQTFTAYTTGPFSEAFSANGQSTTAGVVFNYNAQQWFVLNNGPMYQVVRGTYQGLTFVAQSVAEPWGFCN